MVYEDDPRFSEDLDSAWGAEDWGMFKEIFAGKYFSAANSTKCSFSI